MSAVTEHTTEAEAEKQDCAMQIAKIGIEIGLLEADAKQDQAIRAELDDLIAARTAAEGRLHELLGQEREQRLAADAEAAAAEQRRQGHLVRAREIGAERVGAAAAVDLALQALASAVGKYETLSQEQANELIHAGQRQAADIARPRAQRINGALKFALSAAKVPPRAIELPAVAPSVQRPLAESDPVAIQPAGDQP